MTNPKYVFHDNLESHSLNMFNAFKHAKSFHISFSSRPFLAPPAHVNCERMFAGKLKSTKRTKVLPCRALFTVFLDVNSLLLFVCHWMTTEDTVPHWSIHLNEILQWQHNKYIYLKANIRRTLENNQTLDSSSGGVTSRCFSAINFKKEVKRSAPDRLIRTRHMYSNRYL